MTSHGSPTRSTTAPALVLIQSPGEIWVERWSSKWNRPFYKNAKSGEKSWHHPDRARQHRGGSGGSSSGAGAATSLQPSPQRQTHVAAAAAAAPTGGATLPQQQHQHRANAPPPLSPDSHPTAGRHVRKIDPQALNGSSSEGMLPFTPVYPDAPLALPSAPAGQPHLQQLAHTEAAPASWPSPAGPVAAPTAFVDAIVAQSAPKIAALVFRCDVFEPCCARARDAGGHAAIRSSQRLSSVSPPHPTLAQ